MTTPTPADKAQQFVALHQRDRGFVMPNPWDAGSAWLLAQMGFEALASTSAGHCWALGMGDGQASPPMPTC